MTTCYDGKVEIVDTDTIVYKVMRLTDKLGELKPLYWTETITYKLGRLAEEYNFQNPIEIAGGTRMYRLEEGFHCFVNLVDAAKLTWHNYNHAENIRPALVKCVIPAGSRIVRGEYRFYHEEKSRFGPRDCDAIVSDRIIPLTIINTIMDKEEAPN